MTKDKPIYTRNYCLVCKDFVDNIKYDHDIDHDIEARDFDYKPSLSSLLIWIERLKKCRKILKTNSLPSLNLGDVIRRNLNLLEDSVLELMFWGEYANTQYW